LVFHRNAGKRKRGYANGTETNCPSFFRKKLEEMNRNIEEIGRNEQKYRYEEMDDDVGGDGAADGM
jgi:hypothetical protein